MTKQTQTLAAKWKAVFVHGDTDDRLYSLPAGFFVHGPERTSDGWWTALVSANGGESWYRYRSHTRPEVRS